MTRWQARHQVIARLARRFPTVWVNPPHDRAGMGLWHRNGERAWCAAEGAADLRVYTPEAWLPHLHRPAWASRQLDRIRWARARRALLRHGARRIVLSVWHPRFVGAVRGIPHDALLYHVNDEYSFRTDEPPVSAAERELLASAATTYFSSRSLMERKGTLARRAVFLPNGVDYLAYSRPCPEPPDLAPIPRPRIGYTGRVKRQLDWGLLEGLARLRPDLHLVLVGDLAPQPGLAALLAPLQSLPNVHFLGGKSAAELAAYPQHFDACAMPYLVDGYTRYIYPLKLHEYLAGGQPAIGTPIPALAEFAADVAIARDPGEWSAAIDRALGPGPRSAEARARRRDIARRHDWDVLTDRLAADILALGGEA